MSSSISLSPEFEPAIAPVSTLATVEHSARTAVPYKELDYFEDTEVDQENFAGRDREVREVTARIIVNRAFVLYGRSGLGKTSLLRAGVFPALRLDGFWPLYIRTLDAPLDELDAVLRDPSRTPMSPPADPSESLEKLIERAGGECTPVLIFDQFEEFFTRIALRSDGQLKKRRDRLNFVNRICSLVLNPQHDVRVVFSLREDYLHTLDAFQRKLPDLFSTAYRLLPLTSAGAREAIIKPLVRDNIPFEERLVSSLVDELAEFDFESARLQVACAELYRSSQIKQNQARPRLREEGIKQISDAGESGLRGIYKRYLQGAIENVDTRSHMLARALLDVLFAAKGTKFALPLRALASDYKLGSVRETCGVLRVLWRYKILRRQRLNGHTWYELRHECLVEPIEEWLNENEDFANYRQVRDILKANARGGRFRSQTAPLLSQDQLERVVNPNRERFRLEEIEKEFILLSAIYNRSAELLYWVKAYGEDKAEQMVFERLVPKSSPNDADTKMLQSAALAAGALPCKRNEIAERLLKLALDDSLSEEVRRAAGKSFGIRTSDTQLLELRKDSRLHANPRVTRELFSDLFDAGRLPANLSRWTRWQTKRRAEKRRADAHYAKIRSAGLEGLAAGIKESVAWSLTSGAIIVAFFTNLIWDYLTWWAAATLITALGSCALGALVGHFVARASAKNSAVARRFDWSKGFRSSKIVLVFCSGIFSTLFFSTLPSAVYQLDALKKLEDSGAAYFLIAAIGAGGGVILRRILGALFPIWRQCMQGKVLIGGLLWAVPPALTLTVTIPSILYSAFSEHMTSGEDNLSLLCTWTVCLGLIGYMLSVSAVSLQAAEKIVADDDANGFSKKAQRRWRAGALAGALLFIPWYFWFFGADSLPFAYRTKFREDAQSRTAKYAPTFKIGPDTARGRALLVGSGNLYEIETDGVENGKATVLLEGRSVPAKGGLVYTRGRSLDVNFSAPSPRERPSLKLTRADWSEFKDGKIELGAHDTVYVKLPLKKQLQGSVWAGTLLPSISPKIAEHDDEIDARIVIVKTTAGNRAGIYRLRVESDGRVIYPIDTDNQLPLSSVYDPRVVVNDWDASLKLTAAPRDSRLKIEVTSPEDSSRTPGELCAIVALRVIHSVASQTNSVPTPP